MPETSRDFCKQQVQRLGCIPFPPSTKEGLSELIDTLHRSARSERHAKQVIDAWLESPGDDPHWPRPDHLRAIAWSLLADDDKANNCENCGGTGFVSRERLIGGVAYEFAAECSCRPRAAPAAS